MSRTRFYAVLSGSDVSHSAEYDVGETIDEAETNAWEQLSDGFKHHTIYIYDRQCPAEAISCRNIGSKEKWWRP